MAKFRNAALFVSSVSAGVLALGASPAHSAVKFIDSSSYGLDVELSILSLINVGFGPVDPVSGVAPPSYSKTANLASFSNSTNLIVLPLLSEGLVTSTKVIHDTASSPFTPTPTGTASSQVHSLSLGFAGTLLGSGLLNIGPDKTGDSLITSTSSVDGTGASFTATGTSSLENITIGGSLLGGTIFTAGSSAITPSVDDVIFGSATSPLEIILNYQVASGNGSTSDGITTDAIYIAFRGLLLDGDALTGHIVVAQSQAFITAIPEPATWALWLTGFGGLGAMLRARRRKGAV